MKTVGQITAGLIPQKRYITSFQGIQASIASKQTSTITIPALYNYLDLWIQAVNLTISMVQEVRLKIGGTVIQKWAGADLDAMNQYDKVQAFGTVGPSGFNILQIPLRRLGIRGGSTLLNAQGGVLASGSARDLAYETSLNCKVGGGSFKAIKKVTLEIDLVNTSNPAPAMQLYARVTDPVEGGPGLVQRCDKQTKNVANGEITWSKEDLGLDALRPYLNRLIFVPVPGGTLDNYQFRYNTNDWWTISEDLRLFGANEDALRIQQAGYYVLDFQEEGWGDSQLDMSDPNSDILVQFEGTNTAGNMICYVVTSGLPFSPLPATGNSGN